GSDLGAARARCDDFRRARARRPDARRCRTCPNPRLPTGHRPVGVKEVRRPLVLGGSPDGATPTRAEPTVRPRDERRALDARPCPLGAGGDLRQLVRAPVGAGTGYAACVRVAAGRAALLRAGAGPAPRTLRALD